MNSRNPQFSGKLQLRVVDPWSDRYCRLNVIEVTETLDYITKEGEFYRVPAGFSTDGASVPRYLRWATPSFVSTLRAAILHDYMIRMRLVSDRKADRIFHEMLRASGISRYSALKMYLGVRLGSLARMLTRAARALVVTVKGH